MDDYISRQAVLDAYNEEQRRNGPWRFETLIESVPAADVAPVVHAEPVMIFDDPFTGRRFTTCSHCDGKIGKRDRYCKHCGAKMNGGKA